MGEYLKVIYRSGGEGIRKHFLLISLLFVGYLGVQYVLYALVPEIISDSEGITQKMIQEWVLVRGFVLGVLKYLVFFIGLYMGLRIVGVEIGKALRKGAGYMLASFSLAIILTGVFMGSVYGVGKLTDASPEGGMFVVTLWSITLILFLYGWAKIVFDALASEGFLSAFSSMFQMFYKKDFWRTVFSFSYLKEWFFVSLSLFLFFILASIPFAIISMFLALYVYGTDLDSAVLISITGYQFFYPIVSFFFVLSLPSIGMLFKRRLPGTLEAE